jgi:hypothetical protein
MSDDEREAEPGELLRSDRPDDPDHGYGQLAP